MGDEGGLEQGQGGGADNSGVNPAWNDLLGEIPQDLHAKVTPHLQKWDTNFNTQIGAAKEPYAPFQEFVDGEVDPEHLKMGLALLTQINNDPQGVYDLLGQQFNLGENAGKETQQNLGGLSEADLEGLPPSVVAALQKIDKLEKAAEISAQQHLTNQERIDQEAADKRLQKQISDLKDKHGEFDELFVIGLMASGTKAEAAVAKYKELKESVIREHVAQQNAPKVLGGGSLLPGEQKVDVGKLDAKARREYIVRRLAQGKQERQANT